MADTSPHTVTKNGVEYTLMLTEKSAKQMSAKKVKEAGSDRPTAGNKRGARRSGQSEDSD